VEKERGKDQREAKKIVTQNKNAKLTVKEVPSIGSRKNPAAKPPQKAER